MGRWYRVDICKKQHQMVLVRARGPRDAEYKILKKIEDGSFELHPQKVEHDCNAYGPFREEDEWHEIERVE